jgi:4-amino-4-deoxy-L-arabinose transferase-like glycosyltransferase
VSDVDVAVSEAPAGAEVAPSGDAAQARHRRSRRPSAHGWVTLTIAALTAVLYVWNLDGVGDANPFYAAAVRSGGVSWKALFFGSLDPGSFITVDKPPVAFWAQGLSARIFGYSTVSMLLPDVILGVGGVLILHHLVRRWRGDIAAHLAAVAFALTPIATVMARSNNPDIMLTFLCLAAALGLWNAVESGRTRPLLIAAVMAGLAFNTKMLQAFIVLPALLLVYLVCGPPRLARRFGQLLLAGGVLIVSAGWYPLLVTLWPASSRPYIGSTTDNSIVSLMLGYNGLDRVFGGAGVNRAGAAIGFGGAPGVWRMFGPEVAGQVAWLLPLAGAGLLVGLVVSVRRRRRTDRELAGWLLWGGWAVLCLAVFSLSEGIFHPYYTVQLAPAVAALAGAGAVTLFDLGRKVLARRADPSAVHSSGKPVARDALRWGLVLVLPVAVTVTAGVSVGILRNSPGYHVWLRTAIVIGGSTGCALLVAGAIARSRVVRGLGVLAAATTLLAGPLWYSITTVVHPVGGSLVSAGPSVIGGGLTAFGRRLPQLDRQTPAEQALVDFLRANRGSATFIAAGIGASSTEQLIIATGLPVLTIGGFNGGDPAPTLAEFQHLVATGKVRYLIAGGRGGTGGGGVATILGWAQQHGTPVKAGTTTLYDLARDPTSPGNG